MEPSTANRADPKQVFKLYDGEGKTPSQIAIVLDVSLTEVIEILDKRRKDERMKERS